MKKNFVFMAVAALVLALAPTAQADFITTGITATAGATAGTRVASNAVDGTGMTGTGGLFGPTAEHTGSDPEAGWLSGANTWFRVDLGATYDVGTMYVWNGEPKIPTRGVLTADIYSSTVSTADASNFASGDWTLHTSGQTFNILPGVENATPDFTPTDAFALNVTARIIALNITADQGQTGGALSELQFDAIPEPTSLSLFALGGLGMLFNRRRRRA